MTKDNSTIHEKESRQGKSRTMRAFRERILGEGGRRDSQRNRFGLYSIQDNSTSFGDLSDLDGSGPRNSIRHGDNIPPLHSTVENSSTISTSQYGSLPLANSGYPPAQQDQIRRFSNMVHQTSSSHYRTASPAIQLRKDPRVPSYPPPPPHSVGPLSTSHPLVEMKSSSRLNLNLSNDQDCSDGEHDIESIDDDIDDRFNRDSFINQSLRLLDPTDFLVSDVLYDEDGNPYFDENRHTLASFVRLFLYDPVSPEFTSLQQFDWAVIIGIMMGFYTAFWQRSIEFGVDFFWETLPEKLYMWGWFTDLNGKFPLYHYMWIAPAVLGSIISFINAKLPTKIPSQDEWIKNVHSQGVQDHSALVPMFLLSTAAMWSGLSLGPELPLVVTGGMVGSWLGILTKQSVLQARVLNLTAASAAVSGFFGFPMAGALFCLELPHRMGVQYFEALSPSTIASIVSVLANRIIRQNDVTGYFHYPFLKTSLPSSIFVDAIVYGFYGCLIGMLYCFMVKKTKNWVHDWFHPPHIHTHAHTPVVPKSPETNEQKPLLSSESDGHEKVKNEEPEAAHASSWLCCVIRDNGIRAAVIGGIVGISVGVVGLFLPHTMFWGEAQLQNLIDKGRTPLPIFGEKDDDGPTSMLTSLAYCMIDPNDAEQVKHGFGIGCSSLIVISKLIVIGMSLGTGIVAGQFWGPLFVGCAAAHFLTDVCRQVTDRFSLLHSLSAHPCVVILCTMGSAHVVVFRSHMGIMLILTLTISAFSPRDDPSSQSLLAGDYSAVFPLLVVSVFISLMAARNTVFYSAQTSRGDITAVPEVLCQPGMAGAPVVMRYGGSDESFDGSTGSECTSASDIDRSQKDIGLTSVNVFKINEGLSADEIGRAIAESSVASNTSAGSITYKIIPSPTSGLRKDNLTNEAVIVVSHANNETQLSSARLDELLGLAPESFDDRGNLSPSLDSPDKVSRQHKGSQSSPRHERSNSKGSNGLVRVQSFGNLEEQQPPLLEQARLRSASSKGHRRVPSLPSAPGSATSNRHRRIPSLSGTTIDSHKSSQASSSRPGRNLDMSQGNLSVSTIDVGALSMSDIEQSFNELLHSKVSHSSGP